MLGDLRFFRSAHYKDLITHILRQGGIWTQRWDDQHIYAFPSPFIGLVSGGLGYQR